MSMDQFQFISVAAFTERTTQAAHELGMELPAFRAAFAQALRDACKALEPGMEKHAHLLTPKGKRVMLQQYLHILCAQREKDAQKPAITMDDPAF